MAKIEKSIAVDVPVRTAYNQMTQFEKFPEFMAHVREVRQLDDSHVHWRAEVGGKELEWDAEITEQVPDQRIAWRSTQGARNNGEVTFTPLGDDRTEISYVLDLASAGGNQGGKGGSEDIAARTEQDLQSFKRFIENRGQDSDAWQREVRPGHQAGDAATRVVGTAAEEANQFGRKFAQTASENIGRAGQQAVELGSQAFKSQQAIQSSAFDVANAALRPFRAPLSAQPWLSAMLHAFDEPLGVMRRFSEEMNHELDALLARNRDLLGRDLAPSWTPRVDVSQQDGQLVVQADLPGIRKEDIAVEIDAGQLIIHGERRAQHESVDQGYKRVECSYGGFTRVIPLAEEVDVQGAQATMADGVLQIKLPTISSRQRGHRIEVRSRDEQSEQQRGENASQAAERGNASRNQPQAQRNAA
ncbi:MAG: hypothetical protein JWN23_2338 [Rhodocyclales bacterium]|nr:hypothetical protein [Rhodocyclales bacterium]